MLESLLETLETLETNHDSTSGLPGLADVCSCYVVHGFCSDMSVELVVWLADHQLPHQPLLLPFFFSVGGKKRKLPGTTVGTFRWRNYDPNASHAKWC